MEGRAISSTSGVVSLNSLLPRDRRLLEVIRRVRGRDGGRGVLRIGGSSEALFDRVLKLIGRRGSRTQRSLQLVGSQEFPHQLVVEPDGPRPGVQRERPQ